MRQVLLFAAWAWANAEACASCQGKAWTRRSGNDDNNNINAISPNSDEGFAQFACRTVPASGADMGKRASVKSDCGKNKDAIETALKTCVQYAKAGAEEAKKKDSQLFEFFFKKENDDQRSKIAERYEQIAAECGATQGGKISVTCQEVIGSCTIPETLQNATAVADTKVENRIGTRVQLCQPFFDLAEGGCGRFDRPSTIVHELSHALIGTQDFNSSYGLRALQELKAEQNLEHADTYGFFSQAASKGCKTAELEKARDSEGRGLDQLQVKVDHVHGSGLHGRGLDQLQSRGAGSSPEPEIQNGINIPFGWTP
ncbi:peptidase M35 family protein [Metarhizium robertsii]|uniref:deuterolysin n=2 Tax=Metarhizium robertsii TaxID=568076 RepID=E9EK46_METRA|nr:Metallopeptidase, catalytic domain protein [Metarhizium robertsii ARSEF 23]EFZ03386.1 Metallopeptidase, catalytic domain protein [Metarhizium robertsii ARSEF 23]EXU97592.1 peptidase M35 family protein [Metarhizium robertsii]